MPDPTTRLNAALEGRCHIGSELGKAGMATFFDKLAKARGLYEDEDALLSSAVSYRTPEPPSFA